MSVTLNHTIVDAREPEVTAEHFTQVLGLPEARRWGRFLVVELANQVSLDIAQSDAPRLQHYAFLVSESEFDAIFDRIQQRGLAYWADPGRRTQGQINTRDGGRGVYWEDPNGHVLEILTVPYGGW